MKHVRPGLLPLFSLFYVAKATNDWSQPCFNGTCSYDIAQNETSMGGTFSISGSSTSISDITPAAGWTIMNCTTSTNAQTIQMVCTDESKGCDHLFQQGAKDTIVRLPEDCGAGPFARVANYWNATNQTVTSGSNGTVHMLQIDGNFNEAASSGQVVGFTLTAFSASPISSGSSSVAPASSPSRRRMRDLHKRGSESFKDDAVNSPSKRFSITKNVSPGPVSLNKSFGLFNKTISCAGNSKANEEATFKVDLDTDISLTPTVTFEASGTILPPKVSKLDVTGSIDGSFGASLDIDADLVGNLDTGEIPLITIGIPGLTIADVIKIGPSFTLNAEASANFELDAQMSLGVSYDLKGLNFTFGSSQSSQPVLTPNDSPVTFSIDPSITAKGTLQASLIPTVTFGVSAFSNTVDLFVDLTTGLELNLNATVAADATASSNGDASVSEGAEACLDLSSPLSFNVGADADFFGLFDKNLNVPIFQKSFDIFQKCVSQAAASPASSDTTTSTPPSSTTSATISNPPSTTTTASANSTTTSDLSVTQSSTVTSTGSTSTDVVSSSSSESSTTSIPSDSTSSQSSSTTTSLVTSSTTLLTTSESSSTSIFSSSSVRIVESTSAAETTTSLSKLLTKTSSSPNISTKTTETSSLHTSSASHATSKAPPPPPAPQPTKKSTTPGKHHKRGQIYRSSHHYRPMQFQKWGSDTARPGRSDGHSTEQETSPNRSFGGDGLDHSQTLEGETYEKLSPYTPGRFGSSGRLGYYGFHSWTESTGYFSKRKQLEGISFKVKRDAASNSFSCPSSGAGVAKPISGDNK